MLLKFALLISILGCTVPAAHADDASKAAKVHELFQILKLDELTALSMKQAMDYINSGTMQQSMGIQLPPDQQERVKVFYGKVEKVVTDTLGWVKLEPEYAKLYSAAYTEQQLDDMLTFYKSPTGQAVIGETPILLKQCTAVAQQRMATAMPEIQNLMKDFIAQAAAKAQQAKPKE